MKYFFTLALVFVMPICTSAQETNALQFTMQANDGSNVDLDTLSGDVLLVVNVASECGLTPQYKALQALHDKFSDQGLQVLGFPCNQFGGQEPGTDKEILAFCRSKYNVSFPLFAKIDVNGDAACDLYKFLTSANTEPVGAGDISWNFEKFVIGRGGQIAARFGPRTKPYDPALIKVIETELAKGGQPGGGE